MSTLSVTLEKSLGWFGDVIAQHHYRDDEPMPMRRRWSFDGPGFDITDDIDNQVSRFTLTNDALYPAVPEETAVGSVVVWDAADGSSVGNGHPVYINEGGIALADGGITWASDAFSADIGYTETTEEGAGSMMISAQTSTHPTGAGGQLWLKAGGGDTPGFGNLRTGGDIDLLRWGGPDDEVTIGAGATGDPRIEVTNSGVTISTVEGAMIVVSGDEIGFLGAPSVPRQNVGAFDLSSLSSGVVRDALVGIINALGIGSGYGLLDDSGVTYP